jgi:carboxyl-terminal processing protease
MSLLRSALAVVAGALVVVGVFLAGVLVGGHPVQTGLIHLPGPLREIVLGSSGDDLTSQVLGVLRDDYYRPFDEDAIEQAGVEGLVGALDDPYTYYLDPEALEELRMRNNGLYSGVGLQVAQRGNAIVVTRVYEDGPADRGGIVAGDRIVSVNGTPFDGTKLEQAISRIRGPEGTTVRLGIRSEGAAKARQIELAREEIKVPVVTSRVERADGEKIGYIRLAQFTRGSGDEVRSALTALREKGVEALVLDLRGDPGGLVDEAVSVASDFLPEGSPVVTTEGRASPEKTLETEREPAAADLPLVVLVDKGSASASEILAGALRDNDRAELVGTRTFGKALVQSTIELRDGGALKLTTARYLTPDGTDLAERGLAPDVRVVDDPDTPADEGLQRALAVAAAGG